MDQYNRKYFVDLEKGEELELPRNSRILEAIELFKKSGQLLDVGIGTGLFLRLASKRGWSVCGVDISSYAVEKVKKEGFKIFRGKLTNIPFKNNFFDVVNMRHSIEHMEDPKGALLKSYKILKPGGLICIATPNSSGIHAKILGKDWPHLGLPYHLHFFSKKSLIKILKDSKFIILSIKTEELTSYDPFKLLLFKIGFSVKYQNPSRLGITFNEILSIFGWGEGLVAMAQKSYDK